MGVYGILCTLSPARRAQVEAEPDLVHDIIDSRYDTEIPGLLVLGKSWDALDVVLCKRDESHALSGVVTGLGADKIGPHLGYGRPRAHSVEQVRSFSVMLELLSPTAVADNYDAIGAAEVHGGYGQEPFDSDIPDDLRPEIDDRMSEIAELQSVLDRVVQLYRQAAADGHGMLVAIF